MTDAIVVAGGDSVRRFQLSSSLESEQYKITICQSLGDFRKAIAENDINAIIILFPAESEVIDEFFGSEIISEVVGIIPLILISSSLTKHELARLSHYRADEFLIEPISQLEIINLINTASLRSKAKKCSRNTLKIGDLALDRTSLFATLRTVRLPLHPIQVRILELLMLSPGRVFTRQEIRKNVWSSDRSIDDRTIDVAIGRIRNALRHKVSVDPIRTTRGVGYAFNERFGRTTSLPKKGRAMKRAQ